MEIELKKWLSKGEELFGTEKADWIFKCPACGLELSLNMVKKQYPELKGRGFRVEAECVGRYTDKVKCDWCAYGLFNGPLTVTDGEKKQYAFDFAGEPFTKSIPATTPPDAD